MMPDTLSHSQAAPLELRKSSSIATGSKIPLISQAESAEDWLKYEQLTYSCLVTGDDESALSCLKLLEQRFGRENERVQGLLGIYEECRASGRQVDDILKRYEKDLKENPVNIILAKRRVALLKSLGKDKEAIVALCKLVDLIPTDIEAWSELSELYFSRSLYKQAVFCLQEVLLVQPNAWNIHVRIAELSLRQATAAGGDKQLAATHLYDSFQHFCRSIELCRDYVRGYCGLKQASSRLLLAQRENPDLFPGISVGNVEKLRDLATSKLMGIVQLYQSTKEVPTDIVAAKTIVGASPL